MIIPDATLLLFGTAPPGHRAGEPKQTTKNVVSRPASPFGADWKRMNMMLRHPTRVRPIPHPLALKVFRHVE
jgi:hypothetical protein